MTDNILFPLPVSLTWSIIGYEIRGLVCFCHLQLMAAFLRLFKESYFNSLPDWLQNSYNNN